jgi:uncharacterized membrane protein
MYAAHMGGMGFGLGFLNFVGTILFFVALFWAIKFLARGGFKGYKHRGHYGKWRGHGRPWEGGSDEAERVMKERFAKGEIGEDEYTRLKSTLGAQGASGTSGDSRRPEGNPLSWLKGDNALETARLRLAKGEITPDEFDTIRRVLTS